MALYIEENLIKDEVIKYKGKTSVWSLLPKVLLGLILLQFYGIGLLLWVSAAITYYTTELAVTNKRVVAKFGLIRRSTIEINISKIESLQVEQGVLGRIFNFGSILISGAGNPQAAIPGISEPLKFKNRYFEVQEEI